LNTYKPPNLGIIIEEKKAQQNTVKPVTVKWERVWTSTDKVITTYRMKTPTGWIVLYMDTVLRNSAMTYVPDTFHEWNIEPPSSQGN
jgi:hypothetical protein